jgi:hypothetical protein
MSGRGLDVSGVCARYGPPLARMWAERRLTRPESATAYRDDTQLAHDAEELRDLLEALIRGQTAADRVRDLANDVHGDPADLKAARSQAARLDDMVTEALNDEAIFRRLDRLTVQIEGRPESRRK